MCHCTGVYRARNANERLLLPVHWPAAWRLEHLGHQQRARLGVLSASRFEHLVPKQSARLEGPLETVPLASFPQHCEHPSFPREKLKKLELACPFQFHAWL